MANMTQEMYGASGKVGNKVYYRSATGKTVSREKVTPKNPQTDAQTLQRVIAAQVGKSYQKFRSICDHSFEGISNGAKSMNQFRKLNMRSARERAADIQKSGASLSDFYNFQPIGSSKWVPNAVILSQGQLTKIQPTIVTDELGLYLGHIDATVNTYAGVCNALGAKRGDQITFVCVNKNNGEYEVKLARVILDPRNGDGSGASMDSAFIDGGTIVNPNWKNNGSFSFLSFDGGIQFSVGQGTLVAVAAIASRKDGSEWLRSNSQLVISEEAIGSDLCGLWTAVEGSYQGGDLEVESELYLNNAGEGGAQGSIDPTDTDDQPQYNTTVVLNGTGQNISGGSTSVTTPLTTIGISGRNLAEADVYLTINNGEHVLPTKNATAINFSGIGATAGQTVRVYRNSTLWFTVNVQAEQGGGGGSTGSMTITTAQGMAHQIGDNVDTYSGTLAIQGTNMTGTWKAVHRASGNEINPTTATDTAVQFNGLNVGTYDITFNGSNVLVCTYVDGD